MSPLVLNIGLALVWCLLTGSGNPWNFIAGLVVGALVVSGYARLRDQPPYIGKIVKLVRFGWYFLVILAKANIEVAKDIATPGFRMKPGILRYPVRELTPVQRVSLANAITLTPGTLVVDVCPGGEYLYVHCMYAEDRDEALADIDELADRMKREVFA
ncbi:MAG: Na+/H+ antiporter subunit E [Planctomycetota bacterium]